MHRMRWVGLLAVIAMAACGGDAADEPADAPGTPAPAPAGQPAGQPAVGANVQLPAGVTQEMVAQGKTLFEGGICAACHGVDASGTVLAPNLRDGTWINADGTFDGIIQVIRNGVPQPKEHDAAMPPMGGGNFTDEQVRALAAYVYALGHGG